MTTLHLIRTASGAFVPATDEDHDLAKRFRVGEVYRIELKRMRNGDFHRKWFALAKLAFDYWAETVPDNAPALPNFEVFRKRLVLMTGFSESCLMPDHMGGFRLVDIPKSISFASMDEAEFEKLYSATINVILSKILPGRGLTEAGLREWAGRVLEFA